MVSNLVNELVRRHLWPIPLIALIVLVAAPLFFLKPAPTGAPAATAAAPAPAPAGELPARAERLVAASEKSSRRPSGEKQDPFKPAVESPHKSDGSGGGSPKSPSSPSGSPSAAAPSSTDPIRVVVTNPSAGKGDSADPVESLTPIDSGKRVVSSLAVVDVRFGAELPGTLYRNIARLQPFVADNRIIAIFTKFSSSRDAAVFAVAPNTVVSGDVECRRENGVCRYVDIPEGKYVRLSVPAGNGTTISRRLEVVAVDRTPSQSASRLSASGADTGRCLLGKLLALGATDTPLAADACQN